MNILIYHHGCLVPTGGGVSRVFSNLTRIFREHGHKVILLSAIRYKDVAIDDYQFFLPSPSDGVCDENIKFAENLIKENCIDVIIHETDNIVFKLKELLPDVKVISTYHNSVFANYRNYAWQMEWFLRRKHLTLLFHILKLPICRWLIVLIVKPRRKKEFDKIFRYSDKLVMLSEGHRNELLQIYHSIPSKAIVIPNGIFLPEKKPNERENTVLWIGRVENRIKRFDFMLDVWEKFSQKTNWTLKVLGNGEHLEWAKQEVLRRNINNIEFLGNVVSDQFYRAAKISCITSSHEAFPMVILESLSFGVVPVINNSFPSSEYMVKEGIYGKLIRMFDKNAFVNALEELTQNPEMLSLMSEKALREAEKYRTDAIYKEWMKILQYGSLVTPND